MCVLKNPVRNSARFWKKAWSSLEPFAYASGMLVPTRGSTTCAVKGEAETTELRVSVRPNVVPLRPNGAESVPCGDVRWLPDARCKGCGDGETHEGEAHTPAET